MLVRVLLLAALLLALPLGASQADWKLVVRLKGTVESSLDGQQSWQPVLAQRLLSSQDSARTLAASLARIQTAHGQVATLGPDTVMVMRELDRQGGMQIELQSGGLRAQLEKLTQRSRFEVRTRSAVLSAHGTDFAVLTQGDQVLAEVFEGEVGVSGSDTPLKPGDRVAIDSLGALHYNPPGQLLPPELRPAPRTRTLETGSYSQSQVNSPGSSARAQSFQIPTANFTAPGKILIQINFGH